MEPISALLMVGAGIGFKAFGMYDSVQGAKQQSAAAQETVRLEQQVEAQRKNYMELDARRKQMEVMRNAQRARALALNNATNQGAAYGSGLQGGIAQVNQDAATNLLGINQGLEIGRNIFGINSQISQQKILSAQAGEKLQLGQGLSSFGDSLISSAGTFGKLASGFGNTSGTSGPSMTGANQYASWA